VNQRSSLYPLLALAVVSLVWGYNWVVFKEALRYCGPFTFGALRALLGGVVVLLALLAARRPLAPGSWEAVLVLGLLQITAFSGLMGWALVAGGAGRSAVLAYTMPFWVMLFAWPILGERLQGLQWVSVLLALAGLVLMMPRWGQAGLSSAALAVASGVVWATAAVYTKILQRRAPVALLPLTGWQLLLGAIPLFVVALTRGEAPIRWTPQFVWALTYNVLGPSALAWFLWLYVLQGLPAGVAGLGTLLTPVITLVTAWLAMGEAPGVRDGSGMVLILSGLAILTVRRLARG
jgi:drug/metabolite transporter (DMT)-like permease